MVTISLSYNVTTQSSFEIAHRARGIHYYIRNMHNTTRLVEKKTNTPASFIYH